MSVLMNKAEIWHLVEEEREYSARLRAELATAKAEITRLNNRQYELACAMMGGEDVPGLLDSTSVVELIRVHRESLDFAAHCAAAEAHNKALDEAVDAINSKLKAKHKTSSQEFDSGCVCGIQFSIFAVEALKEQG